MAAIIDLAGFLPFAHQNFWIAGDDLAVGGKDGRETIVGAENRFWTGTIEMPSLTMTQAYRARSVGDRLRGRQNWLRVTLGNAGTPNMAAGLTAYYHSLGITDADIARGYTLFDDGYIFDDSHGFALPGSDAPTVAADVAAGASVVVMLEDMGRALVPGAFFSINDHLYRVAENEDGIVTFNPPLRRAVAAGDAVEVLQPTALFRLAKPDGWRVVQDYCFNARPTVIEVVEVIDHG